MPIPWVEVVLVLVLVVVNAAFAGSEVALISLREGQLRRLEAEGGRGRLVAQLARDPNQFLSTIQIGITLAGFLASAAAAVALAEPLVPLLGFLGGAAEAVAVVLVTVVLTYLTLVIGELAPKRIALQRPEPWAKRAARPLTLITTLTRPAVWLLSKSTDLLVRLAGGDPNLQRETVTEEEVRDLVATQASFSPQHRTILVGALELTERVLRDVLVPRRQVVALWPPTPPSPMRCARWCRPPMAGRRSTGATWTRSSGWPTWSTWWTPRAGSPSMFARRWRCRSRSGSWTRCASFKPNARPWRL
jgi:putative hemolysin